MDKLVWVKEIKGGTTKALKPFTIVTDQDNRNWNLFNGEQVELHKAYLFTFELDTNGFHNVKNIKPVVNIFIEKALKEVASRTDIVRNLSTCLSYSKDMVIGGAIQMPELYNKAMEMHNWIQENADNLMPKQDI